MKPGGGDGPAGHASRTRTGDTPQGKRQRQKLTPPDILLTTPEQLALLMLANKEAERFFKDLKYVIFDELHSLVTSKRGHLLALGLARMRRLAARCRTIGLSATVAEPDGPAALAGRRRGSPGATGRSRAWRAALPDHHHPETDERIPWSGHSARYAMSGGL
jgi:ATP-dependent Lhr-like helicase